MRLFKDSEDTVRVQWYHTDEDAEPIPFPTRYGSGVWASNTAPWDGPGEVEDTREWVPCDECPPAPFGLVGSEEQHREGPSVEDEGTRIPVAYCSDANLRAGIRMIARPDRVQQMGHSVRLVARLRDPSSPPLSWTFTLSEVSAPWAAYNGSWTVPRNPFNPLNNWLRNDGTFYVEVNRSGSSWFFKFYLGTLTNGAIKFVSNAGIPPGFTQRTCGGDLTFGFQCPTGAVMSWSPNW